MSTRPDHNNLPEFYKNYVSYVSHLDMMEALYWSGEETQRLLRSIASDKESYRYQPEKWSIRELIGHIIDAERIFCYRALRFARQDATPLEGFDENKYVPNSGADIRPLRDLAQEAARLRASTIDMFGSFTPAMLQQTGAANGKEIAVVNLGYIVAGHETHHRTIITQRYLS